MNFDTYSLILDGDKVLAKARSEMDNGEGSLGYTSWQAELSYEKVQKTLSKLEEHGLGSLEEMVTVKKEWDNLWDYSRNNTDSETYKFPVEVQLEKKDDKINLKIKFQDNMNIYF